jgi:hypothetical protein
MQAETREPAGPRRRGKLRTSVDDSITYLGLTLVASNATALTFHVGATLAAVWMVLATAGLLGVVYLTVKSLGGDKTAHRRLIVVSGLTIATWMTGAIGLGSAGAPAALVLAIVCCSSWSMHVILMGQRSGRLASPDMLSIATAPLTLSAQSTRSILRLRRGAMSPSRSTSMSWLRGFIACRTSKRPTQHLRPAPGRGA